MSRTDAPRFFDKIWCDQGHVMPVTAPACPTCRNTIAVIASDLLEQLHLGLLLALDPEPLIGRRHDKQELLAFIPGMVEDYRTGLIDEAELMR